MGWARYDAPVRPATNDVPRWVNADVPRRVVVALAAVVLALSAAAFWPATDAGLSLYDDQGFLIEHNGWRHLSGESLRWMFTTMVMGHYQPLTYLSYSLEEALFGITPEHGNGYHVTNILLHACNAVMVYVLGVRLMRAATGKAATGGVHACAAVAALLWGVNPLRVESVAWVTERRDVLSAFFLLMAALAYVRWAVGRTEGKCEWKWYAWTIGALVLSLFSKAWGMSFFVMAVLIDIYPLRRLPLWPWQWFHRPSMMVLLEKAPLALLGVVFMIVAAKAQASTPFTVHTLATWGVDDRLCQACYGLVFYPWKTVWPTRLSALYELPATASVSQVQWLVPMVIVVVGGVVVLLLARKRPGLAVAVAAYVVLIAPVLGIMQSGIQLVAERYAYLSMIPLMIGAAALLHGWLVRGVVRGQGMVLVWAGCLGLSSLWCIMSWRQSQLWNDTLYLWHDAIVNGHDGPMLRSFYANRLMMEKEFDAAESHYKRALEIDPAYGDAWMGMGLVQRERKNWAGARDAFVKATEDPKQRMKALLALGLMYANEKELNNPSEALKYFDLSVQEMEKLGGDYILGRPYLHLGTVHGILGDDAKAELYLKKAAGFADSRKEAEELLADLKATPADGGAHGGGK